MVSFFRNPPDEMEFFRCRRLSHKTKSPPSVPKLTDWDFGIPPTYNLCYGRHCQSANHPLVIPELRNDGCYSYFEDTNGADTINCGLCRRCSSRITSINDETHMGHCPILKKQPGKHLIFIKVPLILPI